MFPLNFDYFNLKMLVIDIYLSWYIVHVILYITKDDSELVCHEQMEYIIHITFVATLIIIILGILSIIYWLYLGPVLLMDFVSLDNIYKVPLIFSFSIFP